MLGRLLQFRLRSLLILMVFFCGLMAYAGTYLHLSRRELAKVSGMFGGRCFLYVPADEALANWDLSDHHRLAVFFAPANWVDRHLLDGPAPIRGVTWDLVE